MLGEQTKQQPSATANAQQESNQVRAPSIALPKGGGAIRGIGEKFAANPVTGTGSMSVPIATSPGRSGFGPQLSLSYDSGAGNGPFGFGWSLSLPSITRKTDKGLPKYQDADESDVFILSGAEDLVPVLLLDTAGNVVPGPNGGRPQFVEDIRNGYRVRRYRPRVEGLFARIEKWTAMDGSQAFWRSIPKDNITTWYGKAGESRIADPADSTRIFSWLICESYDDKGNAMRYRYKDENSDRVALSAANERNRSRTAQRYLKRIKYGNKTPHQRANELSQHPENDWMFEVVFDYGEHYIESSGTGDDQRQPTTVLINDSQRQWAIRQNPFSSYRSGFEVRTYRLCQRVLMFHHFAELGRADYLVRATHFQYRHGPSASFISTVTQSGYVLQGNTYLKKSLPPVEFEYSAANIDETVRDIDAESLENLPYGLDDANYQWVDLDGEGLSGILTEQGGAWFYKRNLGAVPISPPNETPPRYAARFAPIERLPTMPSSANLKGGQQLLDLAGDGQLDVVEFDGPAPASSNAPVTKAGKPLPRLHRCRTSHGKTPTSSLSISPAMATPMSSSQKMKPLPGTRRWRRRASVPLRKCVRSSTRKPGRDSCSPMARSLFIYPIFPATASPIWSASVTAKCVTGPIWATAVSAKKSRWTTRRGSMRPISSTRSVSVSPTSTAPGR